MRALWEVTIFAALSGFIYILITLYTQNLATIGDFAFVSSTFIGVIHNIWHLMDQYVRFSEMHGKCIQALDIMSLHEIEDAANAADVLQFNGAITFKNVTFSHTDGEALFSNKSIEIPAKQKVGLVGFSGSGKSTFINLILRLYEIDRGEIMIDQHHIHDVKLASLRAAVSLIPQDPSLLNRSIKENIQYGCFSASDEQIIEASKLAHAHSFISDLPQGYDTVVGEKGAKLSGGQKQRIAIARAILKQAPILILDEATSALDSVTENFIQDSLNLLFKNRTTLVIAHRLSTLSMMDRILVFDKGEIVEDGNHIELLSLGGQYAKMWALQSGGFIQDQ
jgi:ATP-binding cassette subfamily B protein